MSQVHNKFKLFEVNFSEGKLTVKDKKEFLSFLNGAKTVAKSVGVEFLEESNTLLVSFGYSEKKNATNYDLVVKKVGTFENSSSLPKLEASLEKIASKLQNVICHEFFVDNNKNFFAFFLVQK